MVELKREDANKCLSLDRHIYSRASIPQAEVGWDRTRHTPPQAPCLTTITSILACGMSLGAAGAGFSGFLTAAKTINKF